VRVFACALCALAMLSLSPPVMAGWVPMAVGIGGDPGEVYAVTTYNGDLIVGGWFTGAGGQPVNNIASWDGSAWHALGQGVDSFGLSSLTVYNGDLIAGGFFGHAGGLSAHCIARWDGSSWSPLGSGTNNSVNALAVYNGDLIAGAYS